MIFCVGLTFMLSGPVKYGLGIALPSIINYYRNPPNYYSYPWERSADFFGGVNRGSYDNNSLLWAVLYILGLIIL